MTRPQESQYISYLAHMLDEAMQDKSMLAEDREGKNINRAEKWLKKNHPEVICKGKTEDSVNTTRSYINKIRQTVHNSRVNDCHWLLGVTRFWFDFLKGSEDAMHRDTMKLDRILNYLGNADDMTKQHYDNDFNGLSFTQLCDELEEQTARAKAASKSGLDGKSYTKNESYKIVNASDFSVMKKFLQWTDWCVAKDMMILDTYVHGGIGQMYVCMKDGFEDVPRQMKDNFPFDDYGLSLIAVSVDETGSMNTCTLRWNHEHGVTDHMMSEKQLSELLGMKFEDAFPANGVKDVLAEYRKFQLDDDVLSKKLHAMKVTNQRNYAIEYVKEQDGRIWVCRGANDDVIVHDKKLFTVHDDGSMTEGAPAHVKSLDVTGCDLTELAGMPEVVDGVFYCRMNDMKSLQGAPKRAEVFDCSDSYQLASLAGGPESCRKFKCEDCRSLKSLVGLPKRFDAEGVLNCMQCPITSLQGCPDAIHFMVCGGCKLTSLAGAPKKVHSISVAYNEIVSLKGSPQELEGNFDCQSNHLRTLAGGPAKVKGDFNCSGNRLVTLTGAPSEIGGKAIIKDNAWDPDCRLKDWQIKAYLDFLKHPDPAHIDDTGHYVE